MRSLIRTRSLVQKRASSAQRVLFSHSQPARYPRREPAPRPASRTLKRSSSSSTPAGSAPSLPPAAESEQTVTTSGVGAGVPPPEAPEDGAEDSAEKPLESEKTKRTRKTKADVDTTDASVPLPEELNVLWSPDGMGDASPSALPPPEIFQKALSDLIITLQPQAQHRATYTSPSGSPPVEPTLGLYCPFEGGDYIVDETVRELARRTDSDVVVLDTVQLAAGQAGCFGKAASVLQLPHNPLHFRAPVPQPPPAPFKRRSPQEEEEDEDEDDYGGNFVPSHMTVHVMSPSGSARATRQAVINTALRGSQAGKIKAFFDELVNSPSTKDNEALTQGKRRSRIIYIRDYPTLAPSAATWYPSLLASVRQRRQGPISRSTSPVPNPMTIIFGMTPPLVQPSSPPPFGGQGLLGLINAQQGSPAVMNLPSRPGKPDYGEGEHAEKAREKRLRERLRRWERDEPAFYHEMPRLPHTDEGSHGGSERGIVLLGSSMQEMQGGPHSSLISALQSRLSGHSDDSDDNSRFFRSSVLIPSLRNHGMERKCRTARRREINELTMRMAINAVGGNLQDEPLLPTEIASKDTPSEDSSKPDSEPSDAYRMWEEWSKHVETWTNVKEIADRAVGAAVSKHVSAPKPSLDPTPVPWKAVISAWSARSSVKDIRKSWITESAGKPARDALAEDAEQPVIPPNDEVIQRVREDSELTSHEQRLLSCIVDASSMPTSFNQVHLPPHTIDSVRTIVSLPLLHPSAFQQGILKQHSMTGCLLFGPPGTGKTLVVRALAKDAGCRMLAVQPSDVMDMYVGEGEKLVRSLFSLARRLSPCVVFLDEIDALFGARSSARETGGALAHHGVITEFMQEMDGLKTKRDSNVIVIGATNRPFDLDDAVLRRLPRRLLVDLPGMKEREEILKILLRDENLADDVDLSSLAERTELFSGSDLKHLCVSAALDAVKEGITLPWAVPAPEPTETPTPGTSSIESTVSDPSEEETTGYESTTPEDEQSNNPAEEQSPPAADEAVASRTLYLRHFTKALKEITPSSSESLGSLSALRKWNEEFGEGRKKRRKVMWGKGVFGFSESGSEKLVDGRVSRP